jgi:hypothetical protein
MSTTPRPTDPTSKTEPATDTHGAPDVPDVDGRASAPALFSTTSHAPLPPAFGDEEWATGGP